VLKVNETRAIKTAHIQRRRIIVSKLNCVNASKKYRMADTGLLLIRAILAVVFIYHGSQKLFGCFGGYGIDGTASWMASVGIPFPTLSALTAGATEFFGGIVLLLGPGARLAAIPMAFTMLVAVATTHNGFDVRTGGMEYPLTLGVILMALVLLGPGRFTVSNLVPEGVKANARTELGRGAGDRVDVFTNPHHQL
jgi:putative oxidoreductase